MSRDLLAKELEMEHCSLCGQTADFLFGCEKEHCPVLRTEPSLDLSGLRSSIDKACETIDYLKESNAALEYALKHAVGVIKRWHSIDLPESQVPGFWEMYYSASLEMKPIREALKDRP